MVLKRGISYLIPDSETSVTKTAPCSLNIFIIDFPIVNVMLLTVHSALQMFTGFSLNLAEQKITNSQWDPASVHPSPSPVQTQEFTHKGRQQPEAWVFPLFLTCTHASFLSLNGHILNIRIPQDHFCLPCAAHCPWWWPVIPTNWPPVYVFVVCFLLEGQTLDSRLGMATSERIS